MSEENRILHISTVLSIPGVKRDNDFVLKVVSKLDENFEKAFVQKIIRPIPFVPGFLATSNEKYISYDKIYRNEGYSLGEAWIGVFRHLIWKSPAWWRMLLACSAVLNVRKITELLRVPPTVIHCHYTFPDLIFGIFIKKLSRATLVYTIRETDHIDLIKLFRYFPDLLNTVDTITTPSLLIKRAFERQITREIKFIPHGLDITQIAEATVVKGKDFSGAFKLCSVCRLLKWKNLHIVLRALSQLGGEVEFIYTIIGDGPELEPLTQLAVELGLEDRVHFLGYQDTDFITSTLDACHLMVMPSFPETFGRVYFEAMARGVPIVCSRCSGVDGIMTDGESGYLVTAGDYKELAQLIVSLDENRGALRRVGQRGWDIANRWTWERVARQFGECYFPVNQPVPTCASYVGMVVI